MKKRRSKSLKKATLIYILLAIGTLIIFLRFFSPVKQYIYTFRHDTQLYITEYLDAFTKNAGFKVKNIRIKGLKYISKLDLLNVLNIHYDENIFYVDTLKVLGALKKIGWIENIKIQKKLPDTIEISIKEYEPYALWQYKNRMHVITETGVIIPKADPKHFAHLLLFVGKNANLECKKLINLLMDYGELKDIIISAQYIHERRWRLYCTTGVIVDLPSDETSHAIDKMYQLHQTQKILDRDVKIIDLRVHNKLIFKESHFMRKANKLTKEGI